VLWVPGSVTPVTSQPPETVDLGKADGHPECLPSGERPITQRFRRPARGGRTIAADSNPQTEPAATTAPATPANPVPPRPAAGQAAGGGLAWDVDRLRRVLSEQLAELSGVPAAAIDPERPVQEYGLSSRDALVLAGYLENLLGRALPPTLVWEHPTVNGLARALAAGGTGTPATPGTGAATAQPTAPARPGEAPAPRPGAVTGPRPAAPPSGEGIAVVGLGCRLPGGPSGTLGDP
jgi:acyl carrier protein